MSDSLEDGDRPSIDRTAALQAVRSLVHWSRGIREAGLVLEALVQEDTLVAESQRRLRQSEVQEQEASLALQQVVRRLDEAQEQLHQVRRNHADAMALAEEQQRAIGEALETLHQALTAKQAALEQADKDYARLRAEQAASLEAETRQLLAERNQALATMAQEAQDRLATLAQQAQDAQGRVEAFEQQLVSLRQQAAEQLGFLTVPTHAAVTPEG